MVVEEIGDKGHVELFVPIGDIAWRDESATSEPIRLAQHQLRAVQIRSGLKKCLNHRTSRKESRQYRKGIGFAAIFRFFNDLRKHLGTISGRARPAGFGSRAEDKLSSF